ncbi:hypothetical protein [Myroides odoratus]|uniref:hypothetical protein n=1 Tax=Myroides odoratus TaxID=256 RepID=UPI0039AED655
MYIFLEKIEDVYSKYFDLGGSLIANIGNGTEAHITFFDANFNPTCQITESSYTFLVTHDKLIFTTQVMSINEEKIIQSYYYCLHSKALKKLDYTLSLDGLIYQNKLLCRAVTGDLSSNSQKKWFEIDLNTLEVLNQWPNQLGFLNSYGNYTGCQFYFGKAFISSAKSEGKIGLFDFNDEAFWQYDFTEECRFINYDKIDRDENEHLPGQIQFIIPYGEDKILVSCKYSKTFCIELSSGRILWKNSFTGNRGYIIVGDIGFVYSNGGSIHKIDLITGESLHKDKHFYLLPEMPYYKDLHISTATDTIVYHDGLLWGLIYSNGYSFVVAIHPDTYQYEWIHRVETYNKVMDIRFYNNRMYLHTSSSELYIYEKEN